MIWRNSANCHSWWDRAIYFQPSQTVLPRHTEVLNRWNQLRLHYGDSPSKHT